MKKNLAILGAGNLGISIFKGIQDQCPAYSKITLTRRNTEALKPLASPKVLITDDNLRAVKDADIVIICVKPLQCLELLNKIKPKLKPKVLLITTVTNITILQIQKILGKQKRIFRAMPNTASSVNESLTCICSSPNCLPEENNLVETIFKSLGIVIPIEEKHMNSATILGACGIAFALRFIRAMTQGGIEIGFDAKIASKIVNQTVKGATSLLSQSGNHPEQEIDKVTTPKGCTITGLNEMEHHGFSSSMTKGILASYNKLKD